MTGPEERAPFSWEALAAELEATREEEAGRPDAADPAIWDAVAAELAARVAERPAPAADDVPPVPAEPEPLPLPGLELPAAPEPEPEADLDPVELRGGLEALLFVADGPVDEATLAAALRCPVARVRAALADLAADCDARRSGITLRRVGEGWRFYTREEFAPVVERHLAEGQRTRLTQAALETLAVIAYRQPVTRARVSAIRGVGVDGVMRTLLSRGLVTEVGTDPDSGGGLYGTTPLFLERLGLTGLDELPPLAPLLPDPVALAREQAAEG
ncbi:segregation and condensation protein B [Geodermatophilus normandii]|uniref:Segregation and condensation protein B n=1 Tax=Geodermatophilus normandii TaxID=1137989 RepID=A0A317QNL9_9ACTN|nr:SMC-Scp complex subunit ScpB [Geodermatophilus normandii]PWW24447.1 segregation and condensation protein B [Geodermatophilus normandii]